MKIRFIKIHSNHNPGDEAEVNDALGNYLVRVKAAEKVELIEEKEKASHKPTPKKERKKNEG